MENVYKPNDHLIRHEESEEEKIVTVKAIESLLLSGEGSWKSKIVPPGTIVELPESQALHVIKCGKAKLSKKKATEPKKIKKMQKKFRAKKARELRERINTIKKENS